VGGSPSLLESVGDFRNGFTVAADIHEPPQQGRPMLVRFCFSGEATTVFSWNLLQSRFMAFPPFLPTFSHHLLGRKSTMDFLLTLLAGETIKRIGL